MLTSLILYAHIAATWCMVGVIWLVQLGIYSLYSEVGNDSFPPYYKKYKKAISQVVLIPMSVELFTGIFLIYFFWESPQLWISVLGFALILMIWISTVFLQVPQHHILDSGFSGEAQEKLVSTNWIRTILWTIRGILLFFLI